MKPISHIGLAINPAEFLPAAQQSCQVIRLDAMRFKAPTTPLDLDYSTPFSDKSICFKKPASRIDNWFGNSLTFLVLAGIVASGGVSIAIFETMLGMSTQGLAIALGVFT